MEGIKIVISFCYNLLSTTYLTFGSFTFSLFSVFVSFCVIPIICGFIYSFFESVR